MADVESDLGAFVPEMQISRSDGTAVVLPAMDRDAYSALPPAERLVYAIAEMQAQVRVQDHVLSCMLDDAIQLSALRP